MNMGKTSDQWKPFTSEQRVLTRRLGFVWNARIAMLTGLTVLVHDAYVAGEGILHANLFGLFLVANLRGTYDVAKGVIPTPWECRLWNYGERGGMWVPLDGEVAWLLPEGPKPYYRASTSEIVISPK